MAGNQLRGGLSEHRTLARAAFSAFDATTNKTSGVALDSNYKPESELKFKAARFFRKIVAETTAGHFIASDAPLLAEYCKLLAKLDSYQAEFTEAKLTIIDGRGAVRSNPFVIQYGRLQRQAAVMASKLRLSPASRKPIAMHGEHRKAPKENEEDAPPPQDEQTPSRLDLMFGGERLAEILGVTKEDDY